MALPVTATQFDINMICISLQTCKDAVESPPLLQWQVNKLGVSAISEIGHSFGLPRLVEELNQTTLTAASKLDAIARVDKFIRSFPGIKMEAEPQSIAIAKSMIHTEFEHCKAEFRKERESSSAKVQEILSKLVALATTKIGSEIFGLNVAAVELMQPLSNEGRIRSIERMARLIDLVAIRYDVLPSPVTTPSTISGPAAPPAPAKRE